MSVKIKISYTNENELKEVKKILSSCTKDWKNSKNSEGKYKKAYATLYLNK